MEIFREPYFLYTVTGALALYVFSLKKGFKGAEEFIDRFFPAGHPVLKTLFDLILTVFLGSVIGEIIFSPQSPVAALAAGAGWISAFNTLVERPT